MRKVPVLIRRHLFVLRLFLMGADALTAGLLFVVVGQLNLGDARWTTMWQAWNIDVVVGAAVYALLSVVTLWYLGLYAIRARWTLAGEFNDILVASVLLAIGTMAFLFLIGLDVDRSFLLIVLALQPFLTMGGRLVLRSVFDRLRARGYASSYLLVIGVGKEAQAFADAVESHHDLGIQVIGHLRAPDGNDEVVTRPILGDGMGLQRIFHDHVVDEVAICIGPNAIEWSQALIQFAADEGKTVRIPARNRRSRINLQTEELDGLLIRSYVHGPGRLVGLAVKRSLDIVGAIVGLLILSPVFVAVGLAIVSTGSTSIMFHQTRIGRQGRPFRLHKFRTMVVDAEARFAEVAAFSNTTGAAFKMIGDPRITPLGAFLRRTSLDELPQLWNVLNGEMSLIGPRPAPPREVDQYDFWHRRRLSMRPGITGLWQVGSRLDADFDQRAQLDLEYIDSWSLGLDAKVLLRTIPAVLRATGH